MLLEGSGAALPPVEADRTVCVDQRRARARPRRSVVPRAATGCCARSSWSCSARPTLAPAEREALVERAGGVGASASRSRCCARARARGASCPPGARVACFTTAPPEREPRQREALAAPGRRAARWSRRTSPAARELERDLEQALREGCDVFLTELKAAAIEIVAERARCRRGREVVFLRNRPVSLRGRARPRRRAARLRARASDRTVRGGDDAPAPPRRPVVVVCAATTGCPTRRG